MAVVASICRKGLEEMVYVIHSMPCLSRCVRSTWEEVALIAMSELGEEPKVFLPSYHIKCSLTGG